MQAEVPGVIFKVENLKCPIVDQNSESLINCCNQKMLDVMYNIVVVVVEQINESQFVLSLPNHN